MKKLMIIAAVVAMVGVAQATEYTFKATLKTTVEKQGKQGKTDKMNFGYDAAGSQYWHEDAAFLPGGEWESLVKETTKKRGSIKYSVKTIKQADLNKLSVDDQDAVLKILEVYNSKDPNGDWCLTLYFATPAVCYRAPTTRKYQAVLADYGLCCDDTNDVAGAFPAGASFLPLDVSEVYCSTTKSYVGTYSNYGFEWVFAYRINGQNANASKTIEMAAKMDWNNDISNWDYGTIANDFALAGQGTFDVARGNIKSINGKIVGALAAPVCGCCDHEKEAHVYTCMGFEAADYASTPNPGLLTAAFGDFTITRK